MCRRQRSGGTEGSKPVPSSGESCANLSFHGIEPKTHLIEDKASGTQLIQELIGEGCHGVTRYSRRRQEDAHERPDRDDREWLCPYPRDRTVARRIPPRDDGLSECY
jgi:hypothetical protein